MLRERKAAKQDKLVQDAERVWNITEGSAEQKADAAIDKTQAFFESMGVKTHLVDYQLGEEHIDELIDSLKKNGMNKLGENGDVTPDMCRRVINVDHRRHFIDDSTVLLNRRCLAQGQIQRVHMAAGMVDQPARVEVGIHVFAQLVLVQHLLILEAVTGPKLHPLFQLAHMSAGQTGKDVLFFRSHLMS